MSSLKIKGNAAGSGTTTLQSANTNSVVTFTLPPSDGSANQFLITDGSGNLSFSDQLGSLSFNGNFSLTGSARRISADFSDGTISNRTLIQSSVTNGVTSVEAIPNGSSTTSEFVASNASTPNDSSGISISALSSDVRIQAVARGSGTQLPMTFYTGGSERARIDTAGTFSLSNDYKENVLTANTGSSYTINLANGTVQILTLTANATITMPTAVAGKSFVLLLKQDGTGSRTVTWSTVRWPGGTAPTITTTASRQDIFSFFSDGTNWYGSTAGQNYTP